MDTKAINKQFIVIFIKDSRLLILRIRNVFLYEF